MTRLQDLNSKTLAPLLELAGLSNPAYLAMFLTSFDIGRERLDFVDEDNLEECLSNDELTEEFKVFTKLAFSQSDASVIYMLEFHDQSGYILCILPGSASAMSGVVVFGEPKLLGLLSKMLSQNPIVTVPQAESIQ